MEAFVKSARIGTQTKMTPPQNLSGEYPHPTVRQIANTCSVPISLTKARKKFLKGWVFLTLWYADIPHIPTKEKDIERNSRMTSRDEFAFYASKHHRNCA